MSSFDSEQTKNLREKRQRAKAALDAADKAVRDSEREDHRRYNEEEARKVTAFRLEMEKKYDTAGLSEKKRDSVWALAWDHGHACGFADIENYYSSFAELATIGD